MLAQSQARFARPRTEDELFSVSHVVGEDERGLVDPGEGAHLFRIVPIVGRLPEPSSRRP